MADYAVMFAHGRLGLTVSPPVAGASSPSLTGVSSVVDRGQAWELGVAVGDWLVGIGNLDVRAIDLVTVSKVLRQVPYPSRLVFTRPRGAARSRAPPSAAPAARSRSAPAPAASTAKAAAGASRAAPASSDLAIAIGLEMIEGLVASDAPGRGGPPTGEEAVPRGRDDALAVSMLAPVLVELDDDLAAIARRVEALAPLREEVWKRVIREEAICDYAADLCKAEQELLEKRGFDAETRRRNGAIWADLYQSYAARSKKVRDELAAIEDTLLALLERLHEGARLGDSVARFLDP